MAAGTYLDMTRTAYGATETIARSSALIAVRADLRVRGYEPVGPPSVTVLGWSEGRGWTVSAAQRGRKPKEA